MRRKVTIAASDGGIDFIITTDFDEKEGLQAFESAGRALYDMLSGHWENPDANS